MKKFLCVLLAIFVASFVFAELNADYRVMTMTEDTATIRVPGEFNEKEIEFLYNAKYLKYKNENSVITLNFLKPGYYYLEIMDEEYVFNYLTANSTVYEIDLVESEYSEIKLISFTRSLLTAISVSVYIGVIILVGWFFVPWLVQKITTRKPKTKANKSQSSNEKKE